MKRRLQKTGFLFILVLMTYAVVAQTVVYDTGTPKRPTAVNGLVVDGVNYNVTFTYSLPIDGTRLSNGIELTEANVRPFRDSLRNLLNRQDTESNLTFLAIVLGDNGLNVQLCYIADGEEGVNDWMTDCLFPGGLPDFEVASDHAIADFELVETSGSKKYHVNTTGGDDTNDGLSWNRSFATLQKAIDATIEGDSIWVAKGIYTPTENRPATTGNRDKTFYINKNIKLYGGFLGTEMALTERDLTREDTTFLDGLLSATDSSYHVVYIDGTTNDITNEMILDGFTIRHGGATGEFFDATGGAIFNNGYNGGTSNPSIVNATFYNNSARWGGAIYNNGRNGMSSPSIENATFYNNSVAISGGAIYNDGRSGTSNPSIANATFYNNSASSGGAIYNIASSPSIENATFYNNSVNSNGGAILNRGSDGSESSPNIISAMFYNNSASFGGAILNDGRSGTTSPSIENATFYNNSVSNSGGAIYNIASSPSIENATFYNNSAEASAGAIYNDGSDGSESSPNIINAMFYNNSADFGGAIYNNGSDNGTSNLSIVNATFYNNSADSTGGAIRNYFANSTIKNSIFWKNERGSAIDTIGADIADDDNSTTTISHSLTQENSIYSTGTGIINNQDPQFVNAENDNFRLLNCSPAINTGTTLDPAVPLDIVGNARVGIYDMGAYEFQGTSIQITISAPTVTQPTCETTTGTIVINATATGNEVLQYSVDDGMTWQDSNTFSEQATGSYLTKARLKSTLCEKAYSSNPVVLSAATNCCPTMVSAGVDTAVCNNTYTLQGATLQTGETGQWTFVSNPDDVGTLTNPTSSTAMVNVNFATADIFESNSSNNHTVTLQWKVTSENCPAGISDEVTITLSPPVSAGIDKLAICGTTINLGAAPVSGGTGSWSFISNPNNSGSIDDLSKPNATLTGVMGGNYELEWMVTGGACDGSMDRVKFAFQPDSDNDTFQDCVDLCEGGDDRMNSDNAGAPDACDCEPNNADTELVTLDAASFATFMNEQLGQDTAKRIADFQLTATAVVVEATHPVVIFQASNSVILQPGFHAKIGSNFIAEIGYCKDPLANNLSTEQQASSRTQRMNFKPNGSIIDLSVFPNPMKQEAAINLTLPTDMLVDLVLFNQNGQLIRQYLHSKEAAKGAHYYKLDASKLSGGLYFLQLRSAAGVITKKLMVQKY